MTCFLAAVFASCIFVEICQATPPATTPWMTCDWVEGTGGDCLAGEAARPIEYYLHPATWDKRHFELPAGDYAKLRPESREIGRLGTYAIRAIRYLRGDKPAGEVLLAERSPGKFAPLMWWAAKIDPPVLYHTAGGDVVAMSKHFDGEIPTVETWAWVWGPEGIARLDVRGAKETAISRVAPGYTGYDTAMDWNRLELKTNLWLGDFPGKDKVTATFEATFQIRGVQLYVTRAVFEDNGKRVVWPE
jgi:hypothetical protein